jgi:hypothetical protein
MTLRVPYEYPVLNSGPCQTKIFTPDVFFDLRYCCLQPQNAMASQRLPLGCQMPGAHLGAEHGRLYYLRGQGVDSADKMLVRVYFSQPKGSTGSLMILSSNTPKKTRTAFQNVSRVMLK